VKMREEKLIMTTYDSNATKATTTIYDEGSEIYDEENESIRKC